MELSEYYISNDKDKMMKFLYNKAITGMYIDKKIEKENKGLKFTKKNKEEDLER